MEDRILSLLPSSPSSRVALKVLRSDVFQSLQLPGSSSRKREYKDAVKRMEREGVVCIDGEGKVGRRGETNGKKKRRKKDKKAKVEGGAGGDEEGEAKRDCDGEKRGSDKNDSKVENDKNDKRGGGTPSNPHAITRLFVGNLPFKVDADSLNAFLGGSMTHVKWITDKETGRFYGSAFVEMAGAEEAGDVVGDGREMMGRKVRVNYAPARAGEVWPPPARAVTGGNDSKNSSSLKTTGGVAGGKGSKALGEQPENCTKLFMGNLSYEITDDDVYNFFQNGANAEVKALRWLSHKDTGDFKGVGYVEFWSVEDCGKGAKLNGKFVKGRPIRIDWTD